MGKQVKQKSVDQTTRSSGAWKQVDISDEFLLGLSEPGFQELEILEPGAYEFTSGPVAADSAEGSEGDKQAQKKQQKKKADKRTRPQKGVAVEPVTKLQKCDNLGISGSQLDSAAGAPEHVSPTIQEEQPDMSAWDDYGLNALVVTSLARLGFTSPTDIQHECLPAAILGSSDIIAAAQTGSGKTLAFALPIINLLVKEALANADNASGSGSDQASRTALRALILCPTRELALQVAKDMTAVASALCVRVVALVGGISSQKQTRLLSYKPPIVVATPGRLWDLMQSGAEQLVDFRYLNFLVLDEADRMVKQGHYEELTHILAHIPKSRRDICNPEGQHAKSEQGSIEGVVTSVGGAGGDEIQTSQQVLVGTLRTYVFSATLALPEHLKSKLQHGGAGSRGSGAGATLDSLMHRLSFRGKPKIADLTTDRKIADNVVEAFVSCVPDERDTMLYYLLCMHPGRTLVFMNAISGVRRVAALLKALDINVQVLHAQQQQRQRMKALSRFQGGTCAVLVATDVAARGLHISAVDMVVQYQLPPTADTYIHRAGRTARAGAEGVCVSVVVPQESERFSRLHTALGQKVPQQFPVDVTVLRDLRSRARLAKRIDDIERVNSKASADFNWMQRQSAAIEIDLDDSEAPSEEHGGSNGRENPANAQLAQRLRGELTAMLAQSLTRRSHLITGGSAAAAASMALKSASCVSAGAQQQSAASGGDAAQRQQPTTAAAGLQEHEGPQGGNSTGSKKSRVRPKSFAEQQASAMQKALHAKHVKKLGKKNSRAQTQAAFRRPDGVSALQVLRRAGLSVSTD